MQISYWNYVHPTGPWHSKAEYYFKISCRSGTGSTANEALIKFLTDWLIDWLIHRPDNWLNDWLMDEMSDGLILEQVGFRTVDFFDETDFCCLFFIVFLLVCLFACLLLWVFYFPCLFGEEVWWVTEASENGWRSVRKLPNITTQTTKLTHYLCRHTEAAATAAPWSARTPPAKSPA